MIDIDTYSNNHVDFNLLLSRLLHVTLNSEDVQNTNMKTLVKRAQQLQILEEHRHEIKQLNGNGRYWVRLNGKLVYKTRLSDIENVLIEHYCSSEPDIRTLKTLYEEWVLHRNLEVSDNTRAKETHLWNTYLRENMLVTIALQEIDKPLLRSWAVTTITDYHLKRKYYNNLRSLINNLLDFAVDKDYISHNIFRDIKLNPHIFTPPNKQRSIDAVFTPDEKSAVIKLAISDSQAKQSALPLGICLLFELGLRDGELCALKYGDFTENEVHIQRMMIAKQKRLDSATMKFDGYEVVEHAKTNAGNRMIPLTQRAKNYIQQIKQYNSSNGFPMSDDDFLFMRKNNRLANVRVFDSRLRKYCRQAGMEVIKSPHDIRRTFITALAKAGMNIDTVRQLAGHENIEMTMKYLRNDSDLNETLLQMEKYLVS